MQVQQPYINKTITDPARDESNKVGQFIEELAKQTVDPNLRKSLINQSADYKFKSANGLANRTYADKKPGIFKRGVNKLKSWFKSGQQTANQQQNQANANQQNNNQSQGNSQQTGNQQVNQSQNNPQPNNQPQGNANVQQDQNNQQIQSNKGNQSLAPANQGQTDPELSKQQRRDINNLAKQEVQRNGFLGNNYLTQDQISELAHSTQRTNTAIDDARTDLFQWNAMSEDEQDHVDKNGNLDQSSLNRAKQYNRGLNKLTYDGYNQHTSNRLNNSLNAYYKNRNNQLLKNNDMNRESDDYWANQLKTLSNKRMINLDNIRFFSESSQDYIIRMYADSLTDEEMQDALKRKNRKKKFWKALKTIGGVGLGAAALYGGAKWYQNGGKDYLSKVGDDASNFISKTGDAAIESGKNIGTATNDEANRVADELARMRLNKSGNESTPLDGSETLLTEPGNKVNPEELRNQMEINRINKRIDEIDAQVAELERTEARMIGIQANKVELDKIKKEKADLTAERYNLTAELREITKNMSSTKNFAESTQLNDEEMQAALARKNRWLKFKNFMKTLGGVGLGAAALYGGAKWYQNGGKGFVQNAMDQGAEFASRVGDAAVDAGSNIANASVDEGNRVLDQFATNRVGGSITNSVANGGLGNVAAPPQSPAVSSEPQETIAPSAPAQPVVDGVTGATIPATEGAQVNGQANQLVNGVTGNPITSQDIQNLQNPDHNTQANQVVNEVAGNNDSTPVIETPNPRPQDPVPRDDQEITPPSNNPVDLSQQLNNVRNQIADQVGSQVGDYTSQLAAYNSRNAELQKFQKAGLNPAKYGVTKIDKPTAPELTQEQVQDYLNKYGSIGDPRVIDYLTKLQAGQSK